VSDLRRVMRDVIEERLGADAVAEWDRLVAGDTLLADVDDAVGANGYLLPCHRDEPCTAEDPCLVCDVRAHLALRKGSAAPTPRCDEKSARIDTPPLALGNRTVTMGT